MEHEAHSDTGVETRVVVLGIDDAFVHVYPDATLMLKVNDIGYGPGAQPFPVELFTDRGEPLVGVYDDGWRVTKLVPNGRPDPKGLRLRLINAVASLRLSFRDQPDRLELYGLTPPEAIDQLDEATASASLDELLALFEFDHDQLKAMPGEHHNAGFWHNWWNH